LAHPRLGELSPRCFKMIWCPLENRCDWVKDPDCDKENFEDCVAYKEHMVMLGDQYDGKIHGSEYFFKFYDSDATEE